MIKEPGQIQVLTEGIEVDQYFDEAPNYDRESITSQASSDLGGSSASNGNLPGPTKFPLRFQLKRGEKGMP